MFSKKFKSAVILSTFAVGVAANSVVSANTDITSPELEVISNKLGNENLDVTLGGEAVISTISEGEDTDTDSDVKEGLESISAEKPEGNNAKEGTKNPESEAAVSAISEGEGTDTDSDVKEDSEGSSAEKPEGNDTKKETENPESKAAGSNGEPNTGYVYVDKQNDEKSQAAGISNKKVGLALGGAALALTGGATAGGVALYKSKNSGDKPRKEESEPTEDDPEHLNPAEDDPKKDAKSSGIVGFYKNNPLYLTIPVTVVVSVLGLWLAVSLIFFVINRIRMHSVAKENAKEDADDKNVKKLQTDAPYFFGCVKLDRLETWLGKKIHGKWGDSHNIPLYSGEAIGKAALAAVCWCTIDVNEPYFLEEALQNMDWKNYNCKT